MSMIESSTNRPIESSKPIKVPELKVMPNGTIIKTAKARLVGSVIMAIKVPRHSPRNKSTAMPVSKTAKPSSCHTFSNKYRHEIGVVVSGLEREARVFALQLAHDFHHGGHDLSRTRARVLDDRNLD